MKYLKIWKSTCSLQKEYGNWSLSVWKALQSHFLGFGKRRPSLSTDERTKERR